MVASSRASGVEMLAVTRVFVGLGIGAMLATTTSIAGEFAPARYKAFAITFSTAGYPLGAVLAGVVAGQVLPQAGWQGLFLLTGLASIVMIPVCALFLPESPGYLLAHRPAGALDTLNRIRRAMGTEPLAELPDLASGDRQVSVTRVLAREYRAAALLVWLAFFSAFATLYFLTS